MTFPPGIPLPANNGPADMNLWASQRIHSGINRLIFNEKTQHFKPV